MGLALERSLSRPLPPTPCPGLAVVIADTAAASAMSAPFPAPRFPSLRSSAASGRDTSTVTPVASVQQGSPLDAAVSPAPLHHRLFPDSAPPGRTVPVADGHATAAPGSSDHASSVVPGPGAAAAAPASAPVAAVEPSLPAVAPVSPPPPASVPLQCSPPSAAVPLPATVSFPALEDVLGRAAAAIGQCEVVITFGTSSYLQVILQVFPSHFRLAARRSLGRCCARPAVRVRSRC